MAPKCTTNSTLNHPAKLIGDFGSIAWCTAPGPIFIGGRRALHATARLRLELLGSGTRYRSFLPSAGGGTLSLREPRYFFYKVTVEIFYVRPAYMSYGDPASITPRLLCYSVFPFFSLMEHDE